MIRRSLLLALSPLVVFAAPPAEIQHVPIEGRTVVRTFSMSTERESSTTMSSQMGERESTTSSSTEMTLVVTDTYVTVKDDQVLRLERAFDEISGETERASQFGDRSRESSATLSSEIEGETVAFVWDEDEEELLPTSDELDEETIEELVYEYDFAALLPEDEVEEGDSWVVDNDDFDVLMRPWKGIPLDWENPDVPDRPERDEDSDRPEPEVDESTEGEIKAEYAGTRDEDGVTVAVFKLQGEIVRERTMSQDFENERGSGSFETTTTDTRNVEGEILWNVDGGHLHSLEFEISTDGSGTSTSSFQMGDQEFEQESDSDNSGSSTYSVTFEVQD